MIRHSQHRKAMGFALLGYTLWVVADSCMKLAGEASLPPHEILAFLGIVGCGFLVIKNGVQGDIKALWPKRPRAQLPRAAFALICNYCNVIALKHLPLADFFITVFTAPIMIALLARFTLNEKLSFGTIIAILIGFTGVVIGVGPVHGAMHGDWIGYVAALCAALSFACSTVALRSSTQTETSDSLGFFSALCMAIFGIVLMAFDRSAITFKLFLTLLAMGIFCILGNLANYWALRHTAAGNVASLHYTQIVTGAIIGYIVWHDIPALHLWIGAAIIIVSGLYVAAHLHKVDAQLPPV